MKKMIFVLMLMISGLFADKGNVYVCGLFKAESPNGYVKKYNPKNNIVFIDLHKFYFLNKGERYNYIITKDDIDIFKSDSMVVGIKKIDNNKLLVITNDNSNFKMFFACILKKDIAKNKK